jgi:hypothetical protein
LLKVTKTNLKLVGFFINCRRQHPIIVEILMQSEAIKTMTARYDLREDRIAIDCEIHNGSIETLHLPQRLGRAIAATLTQRLSRDALFSEFAQHEAVSTKVPSEAVCGDAAVPPWLVTHLHLQDFGGGVRVIFAHEEQRAVHIECDDKLLRNIVDILYKAFGLAEWPRDVFPAWVDPASLAGNAGSRTN